ncbi:MAG TPA: histidine kinase [Chitinophagaceae bacterium]
MRTSNSLYWLFQLCGWGLFALINVFFAITFDRLTSPYMYRLSVFLVLGIVITHLMRWFVHRINLLLRPLNQQIPGFIFLTFFVSVVLAIIEVGLFNMLNIKSEQYTNYTFFGLLLVNTFNSFIYLFIWNCIYFIYHYIQKSRKQQVNTLQLEALVKELELKTIKAHINPHFIFNSLNSIRALVDENPERARKAITELSNILRSSMQADKSETVTLEKELFIVKDYLALENMRFEDRLRIEYEIDEDTLDQPVPPMMLQTLVENAIKHGISKQINGGVVRVISEFNGDYHEMAVQNTGYLNGARSAEGFGLSSTTERLNLLYGNKAKFEIRQASSSLVEARVLIPFESEIR